MPVLVRSDGGADQSFWGPNSLETRRPGCASTGSRLTDLGGIVMGLWTIVFRGRLQRGCLLSLAMPVHQLIDARLKAARAVGKKAEFGHVAHAHPLLEFIANVALGGLQASHRLFLGCGNVLDSAVHGHIHPR